jgi:hypothetical protein
MALMAAEGCSPEQPTQDIFRLELVTECHHESSTLPTGSGHRSSQPVDT